MKGDARINVLYFIYIISAIGLILQQERLFETRHAQKANFSTYFTLTNFLLVSF